MTIIVSICKNHAKSSFELVFQMVLLRYSTIFMLSSDGSDSSTMQQKALKLGKKYLGLVLIVLVKLKCSETPFYTTKIPSTH